ncbi:hypothetical protein PHYBLDRAFT_169919 [Phycomyces blakesleeanus NRRL 1555(-)]|uniref:ISXO2-like transposase domain-containing protein n=1 Tax=Phycomyces blakesleeanus (strain ATCC 8743b / DSM 1359 / FGSC 10004 / NBRC 33097 / NRRL 1555) TaxID=763407 RepID=A0A163DKW8_PHYB8|nr:hypothetical protein PHYBLDRAFT_169919 [Phycomyces blakesleeanus NRRL 1555(-)]OAD72010.1 hypothetical protein PHYBLDRAFT_169919 [Phycomyces blakesleeanus NRRL 1555(-)]|eukprot:XP_018290050.1 hypothetical protein PHYBLDRAFT_169919 [Phycomyces blakesleeanus NRRL 1555(-)]
MALTYTSEFAKQYLIAQSALYPQNHIIFTCSGGSSMDYIFEKDRGYSYRCSGVNNMGATCCKRERKSERLDSFFAQRHLSYNVVMQGIYYWLNWIPRMTMGVMLGVSPETIRHLIASIHQLIQMDLTNNDMRIRGIDANGQSIIVEIDESKFGKRKYHQGHRVEVPQRDAATLLQVIKKHVKPNSIIHTDCWAAYGGLTSVVDMNYTHRTVNHNVEYVTSDGIHTNTIEVCGME